MRAALAFLLSLTAALGGCRGGDDPEDPVYVARPSAPTGVPMPASGVAPARVAERILFIDDADVEVMAELERVVGRVNKENGGLPVLEPVEEWEHPIRFGFYTSVVFDEARGLFQMWYMAQANEHRDRMERESPYSAVGYAESTDGVSWTRTRVGLPRSELPVIDGPAQPEGMTTNVVLVGHHGFNVLLDPTLPAGHPERYKAAYDNETVGDSETWLSRSADGIAWTPYLEMPVIGRAADTANQIQWDPIAGTYIMVVREDLAGDVKVGEVRGSRVEERSSERSIADAPGDWRARSILQLDREGLEAEADRRQIHATLVYPHAGLYLAFIFAMEHNLSAGPVQGAVDLDHRPEERVQNFYVVPSRDGRTWDYDAVYCGEPCALVPRGPDGAWDQGQVHSVNLVTRGDRHYLFYNGSVERFGHGDSLAVMGIGLATLRLDGFFALRAGNSGGTVTTRTLVLDGDALLVNADGGEGELCVELLDPDGAPLPGHAAADCDPVTGDSLRHVASWRGGSDLSSLRGRTVRIRVSMTDAELYALYVVDP